MSLMSSRGRIAGALAVLLFFATSPLGAQRDRERGPWPAFAADSAFIELADPLARAIDRHLDSLGVTPSDSGYFFVSVEEGDRNPRAAIIDPAVPDSARAGIGPLVTELLNRKPAGTPLILTFRLGDPEIFARITRAPSTARRVRESRPRLANEDEVRRLMQAMVAATDSLKERVEAVLQARLDTRGRVVAARFLRPTGHPQLDPYLVTLAYRIHFAPAMIDGEPVPAWIVMPLRFERRR